MFLEDRLTTLKFWIEERENIRRAKDRGDSKPWTDDPILQSYRFCNVHREDDTVTKWIRNNWRLPYADHPNMVGAMAMARLVNWPDTLDELGFPEKWDRDRFIRIIEARRKTGKKSWTGAYMVTAEMGEGAPPKEVSVAKTLDWFFEDEPWDLDSCQHAWFEFQEAPRVGSFISAQIVADLKHTPVLSAASDKDTFCAPGPGSINGLNWLTGTPMMQSWRQDCFERVVNQLRKEVEHVEPMDAQDMQNCLCEIFKYQRGSSRSKYNGKG